MVRIVLLPFFKLCMACTMGILLYHFAPSLPVVVYWLFSISTLAISMAILLAKWTPKPSRAWIKAVLFFICFVALSALNTHYTQDISIPNFSQSHPQQVLLLEVIESPIQKEKSTKCLAKILAVDDYSWHSSKGKILLYFLDSITEPAILGRTLLVKTQYIQKLEEPKNPGQFNYANFLAKNGIFHQAFLRNDDYIFSDNTPKASFHTTMSHFRKKLLQNLAYLPHSTRAVAEALLLGFKENINTDTRTTFSKTGTMHILAVSGLHVGIIYKVLEGLLFFIFWFRRGRARFIKIVILLLGLWFYALLTGMPPSVMRAALMFSVVAIGTNISRPNNIYNNVLLSGFILLLVSPKLLFDLSFQLSYAAVFGIITFQPIFSKWIYVKNRILKFFWSLITVSLAAQISTFPITLFYFHQMPIIFPISNLVAIPGAFLVVVFGGFLQLCSLFGGALLQTVKVVYDNILYLLVESIDILSRLPFANIDKIIIAEWDLFLLYFVILAISFGFFNKNKKVILTAIALIAIEQGIYLYKDIKERNVLEFVVFSNSQESLYGVKNQNEAILASFQKPKKDFSYNTEGWINDVKNITVLSLDTDTFYQNSVMIISLKIWAVGMAYIAFDPKVPQPCIDYYVFSKNADFDLLDKIESQKCVFDSSVNAEWVLKKYPTFVDAHFVQRDGAFVNRF